MITNLAMNAIQASAQGGVVDLRVSRERATAPAEMGAAEVSTVNTSGADLPTFPRASDWTATAE